MFYIFKSQERGSSSDEVKKISEEVVKCLSDSNRIQIHNHLVPKRILNHFAKLASYCHLNFRYHTCFNKQFLDIQATIKFRFTLKCKSDIIRHSEVLVL